MSTPRCVDLTTKKKKMRKRDDVPPESPVEDQTPFEDESTLKEEQTITESRPKSPEIPSVVVVSDEG